MIYFIRSADGSRIKIGTSIRLNERLKQLRNDYDDMLEVVAVTDGSYNVEKALHLQFRHLRIVNEWFEPAAELMHFIASNARPWDGKDKAPPRVQKSYPASVTISGKGGWRDWVGRLSVKLRTHPASLIDRALAELAERVGFEEPPPRMSA